jgi:flagellar biosynthesis anti-sigma factor FlgM
MKIGVGTPPAKIDTRIPSQNPAIGEASKEGNQDSNAAKVTVSPSAATLNSIQEDLAKLPDVRIEKVEEIRKEIESGQYLRPADQIASKMIVRSLIDSSYQK